MQSLFPENITPEIMNLRCQNTLVSHLGIEFTEIGSHYLCAKMPVDMRTKQPAGLLHGGASVVLAETLGSAAAYLCVDPEKFYCVGLEINANHIRSVTSGYVYGRTEPLHIGRKTQVWEIKIYDENQKLVCVSRHTVAVISKEELLQKL
ncbi:MAG: hotdog fold thioesterase [Bacteroidia bacterium]|nr:hotdog fold thioesterase [Bacteroidia bacterium]MDW8300887.1 hotdog fold thioesterase [Bacteroidia bacterium]